MQCYKLFRGTYRIHTAIATAVTFPTVGFLFFLASVIAEHAAKSSAALSYLVFAKILIVWFAVSVPLVLVGSILGYLKRLSDTRIHSSLLIRTFHKTVWTTRFPLLAFSLMSNVAIGVVPAPSFFHPFHWHSPLWSNGY